MNWVNGPLALEPAMDLRRVLADVPEYDRFLTVDEMHTGLDRLAAAYPAVTRLRRVGTSRLGEPIRMLSIGSGSRQALLFGCPHPNEPIGGMLIHYWSERLCRDEALRTSLDYTWHVIPTVDPDGTRLNEGWFAGPFTPTNYARHFYRPAGFEQVEWTFPISYKQLYFDASLPETEMLMRVIDEVKPALMASLHNAGFSGVYYYVSHGDEAFFDQLHELPVWEGLPLQLGEAEVPWAQPLAPAIFPLLETSVAYDHIAANGGDPTREFAGTSSFEYARPHGTFSIVTEVAYFDDPRVNDETPTTENRRAANLARLDASLESRAVMTRYLDAVTPELRAHTPFETTVRWWLGLHNDQAAERHWIETNPDMDRPATVAESFSNRVMPQFYRLCWQGLLVRMLEAEVAIGHGTPGIRRTLAEATETFERWGAQLEADLEFRTVPIRSLVSVQLGAILAAVEYLARAGDCRPRDV